MAADKRHKWTDEEVANLVRIVEVDLDEHMTMAKADGGIEAVWAQVPGRLGIFVTPEACKRMYATVLRDRRIVQTPDQTGELREVANLLLVAAEETQTRLRSIEDTTARELGAIRAAAEHVDQKLGRLIAALEAETKR